MDDQGPVPSPPPPQKKDRAIYKIREPAGKIPLYKDYQNNDYELF
jgi:hypothetical protein